ncbi:MAG: drug resistance transporter, EmrB/QacA subfamily [Ilumatobacteraceae bacterium]|nr:drug resistance transporter, EmrB/QacA subfamily [Ilumatobacteraceae bacterium]
MNLADAPAADRPGEGPGLRYGTPQAWWTIVAVVLGSGIVFLDGTVVNVALPAIGSDLGTTLGGMQWTVNAYLVTLSSLLLLGGSMGDQFGRRRVFVAGLLVFTAASVLCGLAPSTGFLVAARALQGVGGALLVPGSLSILAATFHPDDRARAIGAWSGMAGVTSSLGPFLGGWLIDAFTWRLIFVINVPLAAIAIAVTVRHVPETRAPVRAPLDLTGAALITVALGGISYAAIEQGAPAQWPAAAAGVVALGAFLVWERRTAHPMLPLDVFRSRQFSGANLTTFAVYAALGAAFFLVTLRLQISLGYSALEAGVSFFPFTLLMLWLSPKAGQLSQRIGPRLPMTVGPLVAATGMLVFSRIAPGDRYVTSVLPAVVLFGLGMAITVAPLTATVLSSVSDAMTGVASGVNNAVSRLAGLLAVAVLPAVAGIAIDDSLGAALDEGYATALRLSAVLCAAGGLIALAAVRGASPTRAVVHPSPQVACGDPCLAEVTAPPTGRAGHR